MVRLLALILILMPTLPSTSENVFVGLQQIVQQLSVEVCVGHVLHHDGTGLQHLQQNPRGPFSAEHRHQVFVHRHQTPYGAAGSASSIPTAGTGTGQC